MVEKAMDNYPGVSFREGNAEELPYPDDTFDAAACGFGLLHLEHPEQAVKEAWRVLKPGGRYTFTVWSNSDQRSEFFKLILGAIQKYGSLDVSLPPALPMFRFSNTEEAKKVLREAGFSDPVVTILPLVRRPTNPEDILNLIYKSIVRMPMLLEAQPVQARHFIHQEILEGSKKFQNGNILEIKFPAVMATARKD